MSRFREMWMFHRMAHISYSDTEGSDIVRSQKICLTGLTFTGDTEVVIGTHSFIWKPSITISYRSTASHTVHT